MANETPPKFNPNPIRPTAPSVAPLIQERQRAAALPNRIDSGGAAPKIPPQYTQPQGGTKIPGGAK